MDDGFLQGVVSRVMDAVLVVVVFCYSWAQIRQTNKNWIPGFSEIGGVMGQEDFNKKINAGAGLVQIYSGFIVKGPQIVKDILKD